MSTNYTLLIFWLYSHLCIYTIERETSPPSLSTIVLIPGNDKINPMKGTRRRKVRAAGRKPLVEQETRQKTQH